MEGWTTRVKEIDDAVECFCLDDSVSLSVPEQLAEGLGERNNEPWHERNEASYRRWWIELFMPMLGAIRLRIIGLVGRGAGVGSGEGTDAGGEAGATIGADTRGGSSVGGAGEGVLIVSSIVGIDSTIHKEHIRQRMINIMHSMYLEVPPNCSHLRSPVMVPVLVATIPEFRSVLLVVRLEKLMLTHWVLRMVGWYYSLDDQTVHSVWRWLVVDEKSCCQSRKKKTFRHRPHANNRSYSWHFRSISVSGIAPCLPSLLSLNRTFTGLKNWCLSVSVGRNVRFVSFHHLVYDQSAMTRRVIVIGGIQ